MTEISLSMSNLIGNYYTYWDSVEFPDCLYMSLENSPGFGEAGGGAGVGEVINALSDMESGCFVKLVRLDELVENFPSKDQARAAMEKLAVQVGARPDSRETLREYLSTYPWKFTRQLNGSTIDWKK